MTSLIKYEAACRALAECKAVDEVKDLHNKADAMRIYAMQAKNKSMEIDAAEIRIRAERRLGEMISSQKGGVGLNKGGNPKTTPRDKREVVPTLKDAGISHDLSSRAQKLAAVPEAEFEAEVAGWRDRVQEEGQRVTTRLEQAGERAQKKRTLDSRPTDLPQASNHDELAEARHAITDLAAENESLRDRLAVEQMDASEEGKAEAAATISELRERVRTLEAENDALKASRDTYMQKVSEMQKQIAYWRKQAEKAA